MLFTFMVAGNPWYVLIFELVMFAWPADSYVLEYTSYIGETSDKKDWMGTWFQNL